MLAVFGHIYSAKNSTFYQSALEFYLLLDFNLNNTTSDRKVIVLVDMFPNTEATECHLYTQWLNPLILQAFIAFLV